MAPKPEPAGLASIFETLTSVFGIVLAVALTTLAVMSWAMAAPESSIYPIYQTQLLLSY
jgi:hypothetical protein